MRTTADIQIDRTTISHQLRLIPHDGSCLDVLVFLFHHLDLQSFALQKADCGSLIQIRDAKLAQLQLVGTVADHHIHLATL